MAPITNNGIASTNVANNLAAPITTGNTYGGNALMPQQYSFNYSTGKSTPTGYTYTAPNSLANQSTTTLSTANAANKVTGINNTQTNNEKTGITTDPNTGVATYANGSPVPQPTKETPKPTTQTGGYAGNVYVRPGDPIPKDANGKDVILTPTSPQDDANKQMLLDLKAQFDAQGVQQLQNIENTYNNLITQQEQQNKGAVAGTTNALFMSGAMQHDVYSNDKITAQVSYGLQQIQNLNAQKQQAISAAKQAILTGDFEYAGKLQAITDKIVKEQQDAMNKINDSLIEKNKKLNEDKMKSTKDSAIASMYENGITDPTMMLSELKKAGWEDITISDVKGVLDVVDKNLADYKKMQTDIMNNAQTNQDFDTASKVMSLNPRSPTFMQDLSKLQADMHAKAKATSIANNKKAIITAGEQKLNAAKGDPNSPNYDGWTDPYLYKQAYEDWVTEKVGTSKEFIAAYPPNKYINPAATKNLDLKLPVYLQNNPATKKATGRTVIPQ